MLDGSFYDGTNQQDTHLTTKGANQQDTPCNQNTVDIQAIFLMRLNSTKRTPSTASDTKHGTGTTALHPHTEWNTGFRQQRKKATCHGQSNRRFGGGTPNQRGPFLKLLSLTMASSMKLPNQQPQRVVSCDNTSVITQWPSNRPLRSPWQLTKTMPSLQRKRGSLSTTHENRFSCSTMPPLLSRKIAAKPSHTHLVGLSILLEGPKQSLLRTDPPQVSTNPSRK